MWIENLSIYLWPLFLDSWSNLLWTKFWTKLLTTWWAISTMQQCTVDSSRKPQDTVRSGSRSWCKWPDCSISFNDRKVIRKRWFTFQMHISLSLWPMGNRSNLVGKEVEPPVTEHRTAFVIGTVFESKARWFVEERLGLLSPNRINHQGMIASLLAGKIHHAWLVTCNSDHIQSLTLVRHCAETIATHEYSINQQENVLQLDGLILRITWL